MTIKELHNMNFNDAASILTQEHYQVTTYDSLKSFALELIEDDMLFLAIHILKAIHEDPADFYDYDYCMGTLDTPKALLLTRDLEDYCD